MLRRFRPLRWRLDADSRTGPYRDHNEDCVATGAEPRRGYAMVCDGVGGHKAGEVASQTACRLLSDALDAMDAVDESSLRALLQQVHLALCEKAENNPELHAMATTVVLAVQRGPWAWLAWAGDSRAYLLSRDRVRQVTRDHSFVTEKVAQGVLSEEEAADHPMASTITSSLGGNRRALRHREVEKARLRRGDRLLLMSDGVYSVLSDEKLAVLSADGAGALTRAAIEQGSTDNVSAVIVTVE